MVSLRDIKSALRAEGLEIYQTKDDTVFIAERPRENLIMDSGVRIHADLRVAFFARAEESHFPGEDAQQLHARVRKQLAPSQEHGFVETKQLVTCIEAPSDASQVLDRWFELSFERPNQSLEEAIDHARTALGFDKIAKR